MIQVHMINQLCLFSLTGHSDLYNTWSDHTSASLANSNKEVFFIKSFFNIDVSAWHWLLTFRQNPFCSVTVNLKCSFHDIYLMSHNLSLRPVKTYFYFFAGWKVQLEVVWFNHFREKTSQQLTFLQRTFCNVLDPSGFSQRNGTACKSRVMPSSPASYRIPHCSARTPELLCSTVIFC